MRTFLQRTVYRAGWTIPEAEAVVVVGDHRCDVKLVLVFVCHLHKAADWRGRGGGSVLNIALHRRGRGGRPGCQRRLRGASQLHCAAHDVAAHAYLVGGGAPARDVAALLAGSSPVSE